IAICEQMEPPGKGLVKREVVRIVTPATVVDEAFIKDGDSNFIVSFYQYSCAYCDVSTGEFHLKSLDSKNKIASVKSVLQQILPKEILVCEDEYFLDFDFKVAIDTFPSMVTKLAPWYFTVKTGFLTLCDHAHVTNLVSYGIKDNDKILGPAGALMRYVKETSKSSVSHLTNYKVDKDEEFVFIDESSRRNLELFTSLFDGSTKTSLYGTINKTKTPGGNRLFKTWLSFPLRNKDEIVFRQNWVNTLVSDQEELKRIRETLSIARDLNRLTTRVFLKRAVPHDLIGIKQTIGAFLTLISSSFERYRTLFDTCLTDSALESCASLMNEINKSINEECLGQFTEGEVILPKYDQELDYKRSLRTEGSELLKKYLEEVKLETGLTILKLGYNRIYGYYF
ncbi:MAG: DNA mismatch repair protein MutS, partial [Sphaerochaetaceae bacterium]|nr:DNA mismatch repair protein MutS [Sphaerochaetaceae bacterium]